MAAQRVTAHGGPGQPGGLAGQPVTARTWLSVTGQIAADPVSRVLFGVITLITGVAYSVLLPFDFTLQISFANWQYFGPRYAAFTVGLSLGLAWIVTLQVYAMRRIAKNRAGRPRRGGLAGALAAVISLAPSFLCCSPVVPTVVGLLGLPVATQLSTTGNIAYFFASNQNWLLTGALLLMAVSGAWSLRKLVRAQCLAGVCDSPIPKSTACKEAPGE
ncbi:MAG TPA: hypothetical protein VKS82_27195 [Streptosporangiaceae bacterium]|jgi:hypothetical protein|nr:hypothetical protein [Streptosporangiaceae bacterium]